MRIATLAVTLAALAGTATAQPRELGSYEIEALQRALEQTGLEIEPSPDDKIVGEIHVVNLDVFGPREGFLQWFNLFHVTTRDGVIRREVLLRPGQVWDVEVVEDSRRRLRDPLFTSLVVMVPVRAAEPGQVDLLVVTRDIWSLRLNSSFEVQENTLTELSLSLSENNVFGLRKQLAFVFAMDQGKYSLGPQYVDKNILGSRLQLATRWNALFAREDSDFEGTSSYTSLAYPLYSQQAEWGASIVASHFDGVVRLFEGNDPRLYVPEEMPDFEGVPWVYDQRNVDVEASVTRSFGERWKNNVSLGYELAVRRPSVRDDFAFGDDIRALFERDVLPRSERTSAVFARWRLFVFDYVTFRNIDSYDLPEERRVGPELSAEIAGASEHIGSEVDFVRVAGSAAYLWDFAGGDSLIRIAAGASGRLQGGEMIDNQVSSVVSAASPSLWRAMRVVAEANVTRLINDENNLFFTLGGDRGLRGYPIGAFIGDTLVRGNVEVRTLPVEFLFAQIGNLIFWDVGHAADTFGDIDLHHDIGVGVRGLVPQLQPFVFRLDVAVPLNGPEAGFGGTRVTAGVGQAF